MRNAGGGNGQGRRYLDRWRQLAGALAAARVARWLHCGRSWTGARMCRVRRRPCGAAAIPRDDQRRGGGCGTALLNRGPCEARGGIITYPPRAGCADLMRTRTFALSAPGGVPPDLLRLAQSLQIGSVQRALVLDIIE
jgi:hypothetical protein